MRLYFGGQHLVACAKLFGPAPHQYHHNLQMKSDDHYVPAEHVLERFEKGKKLLDQYYNMPDQLTLIENIILTMIGISLFTYGTTWKNGKKIPCSHK